MEINEYNAGIIIAIISLLGTMATALLQFFRDRAQIKKEKESLKLDITKTEVSAVESIADLALKLNKQEVETLRLVIEDLKIRNKYLEDELTSCQIDHMKHTEENSRLEEKLRQVTKELNRNKDKVEELMNIVNCMIPNKPNSSSGKEE